MNFQTLFFSPAGRIGPRTFAQGLILLTGAVVIIGALMAVTAQQLSLLTYLLFFPYVCVVSKRLHDAGMTAWFAALLLIGHVLIVSVAGALLLPLLSPEAYKMNVELQQKVLEAGSLRPVIERPSEEALEFARLSQLTMLASFLVSSAIIGYGLFRLKPDAGANVHGPPTDEARR
jgi:uncharacterized membrane protein YhaH (DUF805 family)